MAPEPEESKYTDSQIVNSSTLYVQNVPVSYDFRFKCILTNTRSILNKVNEFKIFVNLHLPDFVAVTETWLDNEVPSSVFVDTNVYWCFRQDRRSRGGGVCLLVRKSLNLILVPVVLPDEFADLELLAVDISSYGNCNVLPVRMCVLCRPPDYDSTKNDSVVSALDWLGNGCARFCVMGDLNLPSFDWQQFVYPDSVLYNAFADLVCSHGLTQIVNEPTRGENILDVVLCSDILCFDDVEILPPIAMSDHCAVCFEFCIFLPQQDEPSSESAKGVPCRRNFAKADWDSLCAKLASVNWHTTFVNCTTADQLWNAFVCVADQAIEEHVPVFKPTKHVLAPKSYPKYIRKLLARKRARWKLYRAFRTPELLSKYNSTAKRCNAAINELVIQKENRLCEKANLGAFYRYVNKKLNGSNGIAALKDKDGSLISDNHCKAELLNGYFSSVFTHDNGVIKDEWCIPQRSTSMSKVFITPNLVRKFINRLKKPGGAGPDGFPSEFYKNCLQCLIYPLSVIFNISLQSGLLPPIWKCALITPVFKKGSPSDPANYRPISLTCIACKLLESCVKEELLSYLMTHNIITKHQHGFLSRKSTSTQLLECTLDWTIALNTNKSVDIIYLDYAKAFDSVVHNKLLYKLSCYGVCDMVLQWIANFLHARLQAVRIGSSVSSYCCVISGVPQGSVLGPVLFVVFVNDVVKCTDSLVTVKLFADDAKLYTIISDEFSSGKLQFSLDYVSRWSVHWQLKLSPTKCTVLHLQSNRNSTGESVPVHDYNISGFTLPVLQTVTDLGVSYDKHFSFRHHVINVVSKASLRAKLILKCFSTRDPSVLTKAFCTFVRPLLEFSSVIWSPYYRLDKDKIENVQRRFTKVLFPKISYSDRLQKLGLQTLEVRRISTDLTMCYKLLNNYCDTEYSHVLYRSDVTHTRGNCCKLLKFYQKNNRDASLFHNRVVNYWNRLPDSVVMAPSISCFKKRLSEVDFNQLFGCF